MELFTRELNDCSPGTVENIPFLAHTVDKSIIAIHEFLPSSPTSSFEYHIPYCLPV